MRVVSWGARRAGFIFILYRVLICELSNACRACGGVGGFWSSGLGFEPGRASSAERSRRNARVRVSVQGASRE